MTPMADPSPPTARPPEPARPRIRTFHARHGRTTPAMRRALAEIGPRHELARRPATRPLVLEVGCGHGEAALAFADAHPHLDVLAVDVHTPGVAHLLRTLARAPRPNLWVERTDALDLLDHRIPTGGLAGAHVFFPDPWPKVRHHKRRFVRLDVVDLLADRLGRGALLRFATDVADYAATARALLDAHPAFAGGPVPRPAWRPATGYERRARAAGRAVTELAHRRR